MTVIALIFAILITLRYTFLSKLSAYHWSRILIRMIADTLVIIMVWSVIGPFALVVAIYLLYRAFKPELEKQRKGVPQ